MPGIPVTVKIVRTPAAFIRNAYRVLYRAYGPQSWWPARTPFEVMVGAILTQNTSWTNVERAIANLREAGALEPARLDRLALSDLAELIRPSGYYNIKAGRLKYFLEYFSGGYSFDVDRMKKRPWPRLRRELLGIHGIGPETADSILLYALDKPVFVVDVYTARVLSAHRVIDGAAGYADIQGLFTRALRPDVRVYNEYHALIVRCAKDHYRRGRNTGGSPLNALLYQPRQL
jgi:endonuclease-3 related protein